MDETLVTVAEFSHLAEAEFARMRLEAEGIPVFLSDAEVVNMDWLLGNALGYIKVQVPSDRAEEAHALVEDIREKRRQAVVEETGDDDQVCLSCGTDLPEGQSTCPACGWSYADAASDSVDEEETTPKEEAARPIPPVETMEWFRTVRRPMFLLFLAPTFGMVIFLALLLMAWAPGAFQR